MKSYKVRAEKKVSLTIFDHILKKWIINAHLFSWSYANKTDHQVQGYPETMEFKKGRILHLRCFPWSIHSPLPPTCRPPGMKAEKTAEVITNTVSGRQEEGRGIPQLSDSSASLSSLGCADSTWHFCWPAVTSLASSHSTCLKPDSSSPPPWMVPVYSVSVTVNGISISWHLIHPPNLTLPNQKPKGPSGPAPSSRTFCRDGIVW